MHVRHSAVVYVKRTAQSYVNYKSSYLVVSSTESEFNATYQYSSNRNRFGIIVLEGSPHFMLEHSSTTSTTKYYMHSLDVQEH